MDTRLTAIVVMAALVIACDQFEYSPNQVSPHDDYHAINQRNIARIQSPASDTITVAIIGDTHRFYRQTEELIDKINTIPGISFVVHTGDLVDFGLQREYSWMHELLSRLSSPYIAVVGNHDLIANGGAIYNAMYGPFDFSFMVKRTKFIYLNTVSKAFDDQTNIPDISWLDQELSDTTSYDQAIIVQHVPYSDPDFKESVKEEFFSVMGKHKRVLLSIGGHIHTASFSGPDTQGISYLTTYCADDEKLMLMKIWKKKFSIKTIE